MSNKMIKKKQYKNYFVRNDYSFLWEKKRKNFFFLKIKRRKRGIYLCLILVTNLPFKRNNERWKCLILRDMDKGLSLN